MSLQNRQIEQCTAEEVLSAIIYGLVQNPVNRAMTKMDQVIAAVQANAGVPTLTIPNTTVSQELAPNTLYIFASRTSNLTLTLGSPIVGKANEYHCFIVCGSTAPTVTWPSGISWNGGNAPTIAADKTYEISILNNVAAFFEI
jgi:hypothetical protein